MKRIRSAEIMYYITNTLKVTKGKQYLVLLILLMTERIFISRCSISHAKQATLQYLLYELFQSITTLQF